MLFKRHSYGAKVGEHETPESPLLSENVRQEPSVVDAGDTVELAVGGHHPEGAAFAHRFLKDKEEGAAGFPFTDVHGRGVAAGFGNTMDGEVFGLGDDRVG